MKTINRTWRAIPATAASTPSIPRTGLPPMPTPRDIARAAVREILG